MINSNFRFVGRQHELSLIEEAVDSHTTRCLIVTGSGGMGKTTLLQILEKKLSNISMPAIIDFDDIHFRSIERIQEYIAVRFGPDNQSIFDSYYVALRRLRELDRLGAHFSDRMEFQRRATHTAFLRSYEVLAEKARILLRFDTCEKLARNQALSTDLGNMLSVLPNTCIVLSGRSTPDSEDIVSVLGLQLASNIPVQKLTLQGYEWEDAKQYIERTDAGRAIEEESKQKIHLLTNGRPIMLDLAVDWWIRRIELPEVDRSLKDLQFSLNSDLIKRFEVALVRKLTTFQERVYWPILYMALIDRSGMTPIILQRLRRVGTEEEAQEILDELKLFSFVKERPDRTIMLHDEMRRLTRDYVWVLVDPQGTVQERIYREVIAFLEDKLEKLNSNYSITEPRDPHVSEKEDVQLDILYYKTQLDYEDGLAFFRKLFEQSITFGHVAFSESLLNEFSRTAGSALSLAEQNILAARILYRKGQINEARHLCGSALQEPELPPILRVDALSALSTMVGLSDAIKYLEEAVTISCVELQDSIIASRMIFNLAQVYYAQGHWQTAISKFHMAREVALQSSSPNLSYLSSIENGLASVYNSQGQSIQAKTWCLSGLKRRHELGNERLIALSAFTLADIYMNEGNAAQAIEHLAQAKHIFEKLHRETGLVIYLLDIASTHNLAGKFYVYSLLENDPSEDRAGRELEIAQSIFESFPPPSQRPIALNLMLRGHAAQKRADMLRKEHSLMLDELQYDTAKNYYRRALDLVQTNLMDDIACEVYTGLAQLSLTIGDSSNALSYVEKALSLGREENYYLSLATAEKINARLNLGSGKIDAAFSHFGLALKYLTAHTDYWFTRMLDEVIREVDGLSKLEAIRAASSLIEFWQNENLDVTHAKLIQSMQTLKEIRS